MGIPVTYDEWVEIKRALKKNKGSVEETLDDTDRGATTLRIVKKSKSFKDYRELVAG